MTASNVAAGVAVTAAVLLVVLLGLLVLRLQRVVRDVTTQLVGLRQEQSRHADHLAQLDSDQHAAAQAVETIELSTPDEPPAYDDSDVTLITDVSEQGRDDDELTAARIASVTLGGPMVKVAAFSHGVRHALDEEQRMRISYAIRKELRRQRKMRRRRRAEQGPSKAWRP